MTFEAKKTDFKVKASLLASVCQGAFLPMRNREVIIHQPCHNCTRWYSFVFPPPPPPPRQKKNYNNKLNIIPLNCCRKTEICNGDQLLDFSVPELVRSQSKFSTDQEVLQNCAVSHCAVQQVLLFCSNRFDTNYYLLNSQL